MIHTSRVRALNNASPVRLVDSRSDRIKYQIFNSYAVSNTYHVYLTNVSFIFIVIATSSRRNSRKTRSPRICKIYKKKIENRESRWLFLEKQKAIEPFELLDRGISFSRHYIGGKFAYFVGNNRNNRGAGKRDI